MPDPLAGAAANTDPLAWVGLAVSLVVLSSLGAEVAGFVRLSLYAIILYVLLTNGPKLGPALARLAAALRTSTPRPGAVGNPQKVS